MNDDEFSAWVDTYILHCHTDEGSEEFEDTIWVYDWIVDAIDGAGDDPLKTPELVWKFILGVLEKDNSPLILEMLAAGPLEDLLAKHGKAFIDQVELQARQNPAFRELLGMVLKSEIPNDVWARVEVARLKRPW